MEHDVEDTIIRSAPRSPDAGDVDGDTVVVRRPGGAAPSLITPPPPAAATPSSAATPQSAAPAPPPASSTSAATMPFVPSTPSSPPLSPVEPTEIPPTAVAPPTPPAVVDTSYRFTVNGIDPVSLDRPARIGRSPSAPRIPQPVRPRLVRVPSPSGEVSSTHLELRQQGTTVVVTDLRSTNGTVVTIPGARTLTMRPGESVAVTPGTVIDIGDGNRVEVLPRGRVVSIVPRGTLSDGAER